MAEKLTPDTITEAILKTFSTPSGFAFGLTRQQIRVVVVAINRIFDLTLKK